jgi:hypothetical protein
MLIIEAFQLAPVVLLYYSLTIVINHNFHFIRLFLEITILIINLLPSARRIVFIIFPTQITNKLSSQLLHPNLVYSHFLLMLLTFLFLNACLFAFGSKLDNTFHHFYLDQFFLRHMLVLSLSFLMESLCVAYFGYR